VERKYVLRNGVIQSGYTISVDDSWEGDAAAGSITMSDAVWSLSNGCLTATIYGKYKYYKNQDGDKYYRWRCSGIKISSSTDFTTNVYIDIQSITKDFLYIANAFFGSWSTTVSYQNCPCTVTLDYSKVQRPRNYITFQPTDYKDNWNIYGEQTIKISNIWI